MHRSGTSAFVRVFNLLGCDLPRTLLGANRSNEAGHWESRPICRFNDRVLASAGSDWDDWLEVNPGWLQSPKADEFRDEALNVLEDEFGSSRLFVLKDPRICRLVPFWLDVIKRAGARPLIVFPLRNPLEVSASLERRNGFPAGLGQLFWLRHVLEAEFGSRGTPRYFTSYDRLLDGWARTVEDAQTALGISWPRMSAQVIAEIENFLSEAYRHHREQSEAVLDNPRLSSWLRDVYEVLGSWAESGENPEDFATLDRVRSELNCAGPAFARLVTAGQMASGEVARADRILADTQAKLAKAEEARLAAHRKARLLERELEAAHRRLADAEKQIARLNAGPRAPAAGAVPTATKGNTE